MAKIAIVSDSTGCIPAEELKALDIHVNYISIVFGTESYREFIDMTPEEFMERITEIFMYQMEKKYSNKLKWKAIHRMLEKMI